MLNWSIEQELLTMSQQPTLNDALLYLGLLPPGEIMSSIEGGEWVRGGGETFHIVFQIYTQNERVYKYIIKACVTFGGGTGVLSKVSEWISKRELLKISGISTPNLYATNNGLILEEFIPYSIKEVEFSPKILSDLAKLTGTLTNLGFSPMEGFFSDLRSRKDDVVIIDFGEDLGHPNQDHYPKDQLFLHLLGQLKKWKIELNKEIIDSLYSNFINTLQ